jgi:hypothetical protein
MLCYRFGTSHYIRNNNHINPDGVSNARCENNR